MGGNKSTKNHQSVPPFCQALCYLSGHPKHLREWWCQEPTPESLIEAIRDYQLHCAPAKEQNALQGMLKKLRQVTKIPGSWHFGFQSRSRQLLRTPLGVLQQTNQYCWSLPDKRSDYSELGNTLEIIHWAPAARRATDPSTLETIPYNQHSLELF